MIFYTGGYTKCYPKKCNCIPENITFLYSSYKTKVGTLFRLNAVCLLYKWVGSLATLVMHH